MANISLYEDGNYTDFYWNSFTDSVPTSKKLEYFFVFLIVAVGVIGNLVSFVIFNRSTFRHFSYAAYLRYLAIFDSMNLLIAFILKLDELCVSTTGWSSLTHHNDFTCKISELVRHTCILMSAWLTAAFSLDRVVAVISPFCKFRCCTAGAAKLVTLIILVLSAASQSFRLVLIQARNQTESVISPCGADPNNKDVYFLADYFIYNFGLRFLLPFAVITISNSIVLLTLRRHDAWHIQSTAAPFIPDRKIVRHTRMAKTALYLVSIFFVLTMSPTAILNITWYVNKWNGNARVFIDLLKLQAPFDILRLANFAVNFFLYCFSFGSFRRELRTWKCKGVKIGRCFTNTSSSTTGKETLTGKSTKSPTR